MKKRIIALLAAVFVFAAGGCRKAQDNAETYTAFYFDTVVTISAYGAKTEHIEKAFEMCGRYENMFSKTREGSDIWNLNHADGKQVEVSGETAVLLKTAGKISELSGGAFDITVSACSELWDFENGVLPDGHELEQALELVDYKTVEVDGTGVRIPKGASVDLGGIAKGYIADALADYFKSEGVAAIVNIGGDIAFSGENPQGRPWKIGIRDAENKNENACYVNTRNEAVVTSGVYERGFTLDGRRYHHILDPKNGFPAESGAASVTVLAGTAAEADALSTACMVLGAEDGLRFINNYKGAEAVFITDGGQLVCTKGAEEMLDG